MVNKPEDHILQEDVFSANNLISFKNKFFKATTQTEMPKIVQIESMSSSKYLLNTETQMTKITELNSSNESTPNKRERLNESDKIFIESSPELENRTTQKSFNNQINESLEILENATCYDHDEQDENSNVDCFDNQHEKDNSGSSFYCYMEENSILEYEDISSLSLDNNHENNKSIIGNDNKNINKPENTTGKSLETGNYNSTNLLAVKTTNNSYVHFMKYSEKDSSNSGQLNNRQSKKNIICKSNKSIDLYNTGTFHFLIFNHI